MYLYARALDEVIRQFGIDASTDGLKIFNRIRSRQYQSKYARQLNSLKILNKFITEIVKLAIYSSLIMANLNCCPKVWHFCGKSCPTKIERMNDNCVFND